MAYEFIDLPVGIRIPGRVVQAVWQGDEHIGTIEYDKTRIYGLVIRADVRRRGHGRAIALHLLDGRQPVGVLPEAAGFWKKVQADYMLMQSGIIRQQAHEAIGHKAMRLHERADELRREAAMRRWT